MFCPNCGNMITDEMKFCANCGTKVNNIINNDTIQSETNSEIDSSIINENKNTKAQKDNTKTLMNILKILVIILFIGIVILIIQFLSDKPNQENNNDNKNQNNNVVWIPEDDPSTDIIEDENKEPNVDIPHDEAKPSGSVINQDNKTINSFSFAGYTLNSNISYDLKYQDESLYLITEEGTIINIQYQKDGQYDAIAKNLDIFKKVIQQHITKKRYIVGMPAEHIRNDIRYVEVALYDKENNICARVICTAIEESEGVFVAIQNSADYGICSNIIDMFVNAKKTSDIYTGEKNEFKFPDFEMILDIMDGFI